MFKFVKEIYIRYKEVINYLIFGVLTTIVNFIVYIVLTKIINLNDVLSNSIAWLVSVLFAYVTNKLYVFESKDSNVKLILKEILSFIGCRLLSGLFDISIFWVLVNMKFNDIIAKLLIAILVVILNYIFSKLFIFKKSQNTNKERK